MRSATNMAAAGGATILAGLSALHLAWAAGSKWPAATHSDLADAVAGTRELPGRAACLSVGNGLGVASAVVAGVGGRSAVARAARAGIAAAFLLRGVAGVAGRTTALISWTPSQRFVHLDRTYYGPLCVLISAASAVSARA